MEESVSSTTAMSAKEFRICLETLRWTQAELARVVDQDVVRIRRMARGEAVIPEKLGAWLVALTAEVAEVYSRHRPPGV